MYILCAFVFNIFKSAYQQHILTCCFASSSLSGHAMGVILWYGAPETTQPIEEIPRWKNKFPYTMGLGARLERYG